VDKLITWLITVVCIYIYIYIYLFPCAWLAHTWCNWLGDPHYTKHQHLVKNLYTKVTHPVFYASAIALATYWVNTWRLYWLISTTHDQLPMEYIQISHLTPLTLSPYKYNSNSSCSYRSSLLSHTNKINNKVRPSICDLLIKLPTQHSAWQTQYPYIDPVPYMSCWLTSPAGMSPIGSQRTGTSSLHSHTDWLDTAGTTGPQSVDNKATHWSTGLNPFPKKLYRQPSVHQWGGLGGQRARQSTSTSQQCNKTGCIRLPLTTTCQTDVTCNSMVLQLEPSKPSLLRAALIYMHQLPQRVTGMNQQHPNVIDSTWLTTA